MCVCVRVCVCFRTGGLFNAHFSASELRVYLGLFSTRRILSRKSIFLCTNYSYYLQSRAYKTNEKVASCDKICLVENSL